MRIWRFRCAALGVCAATVLAGCGGASPTAALAIPQVQPAHAAPKTSSSMLIYAANHYYGDAVVYIYRHGPYVGTARVPGAMGECVNSAGQVFVSAFTENTVVTGEIYEFAHGGLSPIATLVDPNWSASACAIDPKSGDLAVPGANFPSGNPGVTFYRHAKGKPAALFTLPYHPIGFCAYDPAENLYLAVARYGASGSDTGLLLLPAGSKKFELMTTDITINDSADDPPTVQWAHNHLIVSSANSQLNELYLYEMSVQGSKARTVRTTILRPAKSGESFRGQLWVQSNTVLGRL